MFITFCVLCLTLVLREILSRAYRLIPSWGLMYSTHRIFLEGDTISRDTGVKSDKARSIPIDLTTPLVHQAAAFFMLWSASFIDPLVQDYYFYYYGGIYLTNESPTFI